jgi:FMN reductase
MKLLVIACSLNPDSRSAVLADAAAAALRTHAEVEVDEIDLREHDLPLSDSGAAYAAPAVSALSARIAAADAVLLAVPIYNYGVNAAAKNLIELTGRAWTGKAVGFLCAAGGRGSYMSVLPLANALMLDFRCLILPRFVYATGEDFEEAEGHPTLAPPVAERVQRLAEETARLVRGLHAVDEAEVAATR